MANLFFPALNGLDGWLATWLPLGVRVALFGLLCGALSIGIYRLLSNQERTRAVSAELRQIRRRLFAADLDDAEFARLNKRNLALSFGHLGRTLGPSLVAALPFLLLAVWFAHYHAVHWPPAGTAVPVRFVPPTEPARGGPDPVFQGQGASLALVVPPDIVTQPIHLSAGATHVYDGTLGMPLGGALFKRQWWNLLLENDAGYLDPDAPVEEVTFELPPVRLTDDLPGWLAGWEALFILSAFVSALGLKIAFRIA